jgi:hypothetical protein
LASGVGREKYLLGLMSMLARRLSLDFLIGVTGKWDSSPFSNTTGTPKLVYGILIVETARNGYWSLLKRISLLVLFSC